MTLFLTACGVMNSKPVPPPTPGAHAQEVRRDQTSGLDRMRTISAQVYGSPMNAQEVIQNKLMKLVQPITTLLWSMKLAYQASGMLRPFYTSKFVGFI